MNSISTINVPFHGTNLCIVNHDGNPYVPMKPIIEGMGLDWASQFTKLKKRFSKGIVEITIPSKGGQQSMTCLAMHKLTGWLYSIMPNKVKPEIRDKVIQYQEECDDVLYEYWTTGEVKAKHKSTVQERNPLKNAVNLLVSKKGIMYPEAYSLVHQQFNVGGIDELTADQIPMAVEYVHKLVMEGEFIPKQDEVNEQSFNKKLAIKTLEGAMTHIRTMREYWNSGLQESLKQLGYPHTGSLTEHMIEPLFKIEWVILEIKGDSLDKLPA
ncbi:phage antirepressor N-terminal domain-containing protein [Providencia alcalifaciens]|uniref:phage antirepressor N-terminal domain-containing protein n=1 Tax=Providencia alcalifaciens TaxID=126385 RepID=UPI003D2ABA91